MSKKDSSPDTKSDIELKVSKKYNKPYPSVNAKILFGIIIIIILAGCSIVFLSLVNVLDLSTNETFSLTDDLESFTLIDIFGNNDLSVSTDNIESNMLIENEPEDNMLNESIYNDSEILNQTDTLFEDRNQIDEINIEENISDIMNITSNSTITGVK